MILRITKGTNYFYGFPDQLEVKKIENNIDKLSDLSYSLKKLTQEEYEKEIEDYNSKTMSEEDREILEEMSFSLCDEFSKIMEL